MYRLFLLMLCAVLLAGCGMRPGEVVVRNAVVAANGARLSLEAAETAALTLYKGMQLRLVEKARAEGLPKETLMAQITAIRERWEPVRDALVGARSAHAGLVAAIQAYQTGQAVVQGGKRIEPGVAQVAASAAALTEAHTKLSDALAALRSAS